VFFVCYWVLMVIGMNRYSVLDSILSLYISIEHVYTFLVKSKILFFFVMHLYHIVICSTKVMIIFKE
jgi:hypothetical protein